nr:hypothetical protein [Planctomycetota bacterium]
GDTWVFDGSDWREVTSGPKARYGAALCYDPLRERVVLQGGFAKSMPDDTWEWDGSTWTENPASPQPPSVGYAAIGYDPGGQRVVRCFGEAGAQATKTAWSFATTQVAGYRSYGLSCAGSTTTALLAGGKELPWIGDQHEYRLRDALPNAPVAFVLGLSDRRWSGFDLPIDLTVLGAGACSLYASMDLVIGLATTAGGTVSVPVTLPPIATLGGARFYTQFFAFDLAANTLGMTFTNGVEATIGIR